MPACRARILQHAEIERARPYGLRGRSRWIAQAHRVEGRVSATVGPVGLWPCCRRALILLTLPDEIADERFDFGGLERFDDGANVGTPVFEPKIQRIARRNDDG